MAEFLLEIAVEELPADAIDCAQVFMAEFFQKSLLEKNLQCVGLKSYAAPRRIVLSCDDIPLKQESSVEEISGPSAALAFLSNGELSEAALGFLRSKGLKKEEIFKKATARGEVIAARRQIPGLTTESIIPAIIIEALRKIPFRKRMRWDNSGEDFSRPIRSIVALLDNKPLHFSFADVTSGQTAKGHRYLASEPFTVLSKDHYFLEMKKRLVMLDTKERAQSIKAHASEKLKAFGATLAEDPELLAMVANLVEYPFVIVGRFDERYLKMPKELLISEMKAHQKCFAVLGSDNKLLPYFVCVAATRPHDESVFAKGNARVLHARFEDGAFYYDLDQKKSLKEHALGLKSLIYERSLGTVQEKSERIAHICADFSKTLGLSQEKSAVLAEAALLIKADLLTGVVAEFPELQGLMGSIYAKKDGLSDEICEIIKCHYWPRFADDALPPNLLSGLMSLADRLDSLLGIIAIGKGPKGNKDPFALRRNAIAVVRTLVHFAIDLPLSSLILIAFNAYGDRFKAKREAIVAELNDFIAQRARGLLIEDLSPQIHERAVNFADAVLQVGRENLADTFARAQALAQVYIKNPESFESLIQTFKRAANIVKKASIDDLGTKDLDISLLEQPAEKDLFLALAKLKEAQKKDDNNRKDRVSYYLEIFDRVAMLKPKLDQFFNDVMVMAEKPDLRQARLGLLKYIKDLSEEVADFTHL